MENLKDTIRKGEISERNGGIQVVINELVGRKNGDVYVFLDKVFEYDSGLKGACGTRMVPVTPEELERRIQEYKDPEWSPLRTWFEDESDTTESWDEWIADMPRRELEAMAIDPSYQGKYGETVVEKARQELGRETEESLVECIGGGRMFNESFSDYDKIYDYDLAALIKEAEQNGILHLL